MANKATVYTPDQLEFPTIAEPLGWDDFDRHYLAEGDSWFTLAALPGGNILQELELRHSALIVNTAFPGDTLSHIVDWSANRQFVRLLSQRGFARKWDAILLSAGGNDLIDAALSPAGIILRAAGAVTSANDYVHAPNLKRFDDYMRANFESVVQLRDAADSPNKGVPIFIHTYDYPTARPAPARLVGTVGVSGPWLYSAYRDHQIPESDWPSLTTHLIDHLAEILQDLRLPNIHLVNTRGQLIPAAAGSPGDSGDWLNEIHANQGGRHKLARKWAELIDQVVP